MKSQAHYIRRLGAHGFSRAAIARYTGATLKHVGRTLREPFPPTDRSFRRWTRAERDKMERLVDEGMTDGQIARELGRGLASVARQRCTLAIPAGAYQGRPRKYCRRTIGALVDEGKAPVQIARELGICEWTVRRIVREITP